jgi:hypothetical protein
MAPAGEASQRSIHVRERAVSLLRKFFGEVILVISGQRRMMYQRLEPKIGGSNLLQEVKASGV